MGVSFADVIHHDKPDFLVSYQGYKTGIEVTIGSAEEYRRALSLKNKIGLKSYSVGGFQERDKSGELSNPELIEKLKTNEAVSSEDSAVLWAERIVKSIRTKVDLMQRGEIERFQKNMLCIANEQPDDWALDTDFYKAVLLGALGSDHSYRRAFDWIYVISMFHVFILDEQRLIAVRTKE